MKHHGGLKANVKDKRIQELELELEDMTKRYMEMKAINQIKRNEIEAATKKGQ